MDAAQEPDLFHILSAQGQLIGEQQQLLANLDTKINLFQALASTLGFMFLCRQPACWCRLWTNSPGIPLCVRDSSCNALCISPVTRVCLNHRKLHVSWIFSSIKRWSGPQLCGEKVGEPTSSHEGFMELFHCVQSLTRGHGGQQTTTNLQPKFPSGGQVCPRIPHDSGRQQMEWPCSQSLSPRTPSGNTHQHGMPGWTTNTRLTHRPSFDPLFDHSGSEGNFMDMDTVTCLNIPTQHLSHLMIIHANDVGPIGEVPQNAAYNLSCYKSVWSINNISHSWWQSLWNITLSWASHDSCSITLIILWLYKEIIYVLTNVIISAVSYPSTVWSPPL